MEPNSTPGDLNAAEEHSGPRAGGPEDQINDNQETIQPQAVPSRGNLSFNSTARTTREQYAYLWRFLDPDDLDDDEEGLAEMFGYRFDLPETYRIDHHEIQGENWFNENFNHSLNTTQDVNDLFDGLEDIIIGPVSTEDPTDQQPQCSICLEAYTEGDIVVVLPCHETHRFHRACATDWLQENSICPLCRAPLGR
ncbi:hypothetical protein PSTG_15940 [Puccinia striiformis f. sp. tritici PST-78]|uniref:RING-type E3 ubiquitin transferase n=1 Tax=Puccinia striiformis f. sp. tritici PST-78 TaxID=1165861 RepID=A0A0L0UU97_9BASI|nr:hypothetical protein PSTG_15940 [Puccinia striiformis f. sp. tritici PST-78]